MTTPPEQAELFRGLSEQEVARLTSAGLTNKDRTKQRSDLDVVRSNLLTFFNITLTILIAALFAVGAFQDGIFVGLVVLANVLVGTYQELRATRQLRALTALSTPHARVIRNNFEKEIPSSEVVQGDLIHLLPGDQIVADGRITSEAIEVDESLLTGEAEAIHKEKGDPLLSGSFCIAGSCFYVTEKVGIESYALNLTKNVRTLVRRLSPLQLQLRRLLWILAVLTIVLAVALMISFNVENRGFTEALQATTSTLTTVVPAGLLLGITVAFAVGAVRVSRFGSLVQDISAVEALNYVDVICLDKTGTITANDLMVREIHWTNPEAEEPDGDSSWLGAFSIEAELESNTSKALAITLAQRTNGALKLEGIPFSSARRWSSMTLEKNGVERKFVLGAPETIFETSQGSTKKFEELYKNSSEAGLRAVVFAETKKTPLDDSKLPELTPLALIVLADVLRPEVYEAFQLMDELDIEPKVISGDNPESVASLLRQLKIQPKGGFISGQSLASLEKDDFQKAIRERTIFGRISPEQKLEIIEELKRQGRFVAMVGDGANDVHALRGADVAVAMEEGSAIARGVAGIILRNNSFTALIQGAQEATHVLGNAARLSKIFITKSFYAYLLIFSTNLLGLDFPFLPRHGSLTALLALGIPAVIISVTIPPSNAGRDYLNNILKFALPAAVALAISAMVLQFVTDGILKLDVEQTRTLISLVIGFTSIGFMIEVVGFEGASWRNLQRPILTILFGAIMAAILVTTIFADWLRNFFDFRSLSAIEWLTVSLTVIAALTLQYIVSKNWPRIIRFLIAQPPDSEKVRGRRI
ncbi:MAG: HAD-IC family P-type ATPase [Tepidiformaceae bacterium]